MSMIGRVVRSSLVIREGKPAKQYLQITFLLISSTTLRTKQSTHSVGREHGHGGDFLDRNRRFHNYFQRRIQLFIGTAEK